MIFHKPWQRVSCSGGRSGVTSTIRSINWRWSAWLLTGHCLLGAYAQNLIPWASPLGGLTTSEDCQVYKLIVGEPSGDPTWYAVCYAQSTLYVQFNQDSIKIYKQSKTKSLHDIPTCDFARRVLLKSNQPSFIILRCWSTAEHLQHWSYFFFGQGLR